MTKKKILIIPDPVLRKVSEPVNVVNPEVKSLMDDMLDTMYAAPGIGLAAVQIGILKRILVVDVSNKDEKRRPLSLINPIIKKISNEEIIKYNNSKDKCNVSIIETKDFPIYFSIKNIRKNEEILTHYGIHYWLLQNNVKPENLKEILNFI